MRAALLPAGGDPFLLAYWLRHYRMWAQEVDELRIVVNGQNDPDARQYIAEQVASVPHALVEFDPGRTDHGQNLRRLVNETPADYIVFCEDDARGCDLQRHRLAR